MSQDASVDFDPALPPASPEMRMATMRMVSDLEPDSFKPVSGTPGLELRAIDHIEELTEGQYGGAVLRRVPGTPWTQTTWHMNHLDFQLSYVTSGELLIELEGQPPMRLEAGSALYQPGKNRHRYLEMSDDCELIKISTPARFQSTFFVWDDSAQAYTTVTVDAVDDALASLTPA